MSEEVYDSFGIRDTFTSMGSIASSSRSRLRQQMVRVNALLPGDILLSLGSGLFSRLIAKLSDGEFSHASLCASPFMIFESDGETLIGYKAFQTIGLAETRFGTGHLAEIPGEPKRCVVYRHPEMSGVAPGPVSESIGRCDDGILRKALFADGAAGTISRPARMDEESSN